MADAADTANGTRNTLVIGLLVVLAIDVICLGALGCAAQRWPTQQWDLVMKAVDGLLTLATVVASGLVGMAKGQS